MVVAARCREGKREVAGTEVVVQPRVGDQVRSRGGKSKSTAIPGVARGEIHTYLPT